MKIAIISSSLNKKSHSLILSEYAKKLLESSNIDVQLINMKDYSLPLCCAEEAFNDANVLKIKSILTPVDSIIFSTPIYNYEVNAVLKNLLDLTGDAWKEKLVGMMCSAGGNNSYMALMGFANSLMLNFRCIIIPRFVYASKDVFDNVEKEINDPNIKNRIKELCDTTIKLTRALIKNN